MNTREIVKTVCSEFYVPGKTYHSELPDELQKWYVYTSDGGHSIVCCIKSDYLSNSNQNLLNRLVSVPVKTVLKGYEIKNGCVVVDLEYSPTYGLITPHDDDEF